MSSEKQFEFTKENIDIYLKAVAKEYRRMVGKGTPAELILVGGASVLINYGFRNTTTDIDALILAASAMDDAVLRVGDQYGLPRGWLNADFRKTDSYSSKLLQFSKYYKTFSNVVTVRTVAAEYLVAMKLRSGRQYKSDLSDILGILSTHKKNGDPFTIEKIRQAVIDLYGDWDSLPESSQVFIENVMKLENSDLLYETIASGEKETRSLLIQFEQDYPGVTAKANLKDIVSNLQKKGSRAAILAHLRENK